MKIIHLCSDYSNTPLYHSLILALERYFSKQTIYVPVRRIEEVNKYDIYNNPKISIIYSFILKRWHRLLFRKKIHDVYRDLINKTQLENVSKVHAHFLFSDGAVAYELKKNFGIDYIVTVRNTDINVYFKYMVHLRSLGKSILKNAKVIIVLNPRYRELVLKLVPQDSREFVAKKISIIPNGIEDFWIENMNRSRPKLDGNKITIIYVGEFSKNKNIESIIKAADELRINRLNIELLLVGNYGDNCHNIKLLQETRKRFIKIVDKVTDKNILLNLYRSADIFLMPSFYETFGLVYLEAMSQGCPVIFSKNQGIDGYFNEGYVGYSVDPNSVKSICGAILKTLNNYAELSEHCIHSVESFSWERIASQTFKAYS